MFGPNKYFTDDVNINFSHRDLESFQLYKEVVDKFKKKFNLQDYDILFIPGSATVGVEALMYSLNVPIKVIGAEGSFKQRWIEMNKVYSKRLNNKQLTLDPVEFCCLFETSTSTYFYKEGCFVDATSAFPYYDLPKNTLGFVTSLNKQLGSYVGLAVVGIRKDMWGYFKDPSHMSYLNLSRYRHYSNQNQMPSTSPTHIFQHFNKVLDDFDVNKLRQHVNTVCNKVVSTMGSNMFIGDLQSPCLTFKENVLPEELCKKWSVYGYFAHRDHYQLFTYNGTLEEYDKFLTDWKQLK